MLTRSCAGQSMRVSGGVG